MKIKRFYAESSREALRQVKEALGPDAVILSNRQVEGGVEIITAIDFDEAALLEEEAREAAPAPTPVAAPVPARREEAPTARPSKADQYANLGVPVAVTDAAEEQVSFAARLKSVQDKTTKPAPRATPAMSTPVKVEAASVPKPVQASAAPVSAPVAAAPQRPAPIPITQAPAAEDSTLATIAALKDELQQMRRMVETRLQMPEAPIAQPEPAPQPVRMPEAAAPNYALMPLIQLGFSTRMARQILAASGSQEASDSTGLLRPYLEANLKLVGPTADQGGILALLGPTGVGKTTTIAKLAARFALKYGADQVALLTTDTYRIAGTEQLRVYGRILGIPVEVVQDGLALQERLDALDHKKLILIDTVGFSPRDERIKKQLAILAAPRQQIQRVLVLNAAGGRAHQQLVMDAYGQQGLEGCIISKTDETPKLGEVMDLLLQHNLPLSFYTDGQRVPEDLHRADLGAVMDLLFPSDQEPARTTAERMPPDAPFGERMRLAAYSL
ncbi:flagellar biosynthesis protein FlhF [Thermithiobacillus plumbiphilus]|uniref:Flagellar biosynthesis protein FlhF n=1 Tax=Thermithiobacillus plumbiphilus TaxID=1729899 RepID=A0ABU9DAJ4_9PROT